ncbi:MAG TPA: dihydrolipoyl dehydrogenase [Candidatus Izemoplasmatales bacterium]|nr:dihydrolipoyl dehydrogenase [Bacillota bacterium]HRY77646.1 dihydrolipoyl dehydrogenase [Candidatus Izemoplasmatales bacterium]
MEKFDLIIIGGGPAGYHAGERAGHAGFKTLLIEKEHLGGVCLNEGCIPSKAFLNSAKMYAHALHGEKFGVFAENVRYDQGIVVDRKNTIVRRLIAGVKAQLKSGKVTIIEGNASVKGKTSEGFLVQVGEETYSATRLLVASGAVPVIPNIPGLRQGIEEGIVLTNREILDLKTIPERLTIIGGGVIGLEMASYYSAIGTQVQVVEMMNKVAGPTDEELSTLLQKTLEKNGVKFYLNSTVTAVSPTEVTFTFEGKDVKIAHEKVLLSIGRRPATAGLGLETLGVELAKNGAVITDDKLQTNVANLYAAGDVNGKSMLAHTAYREAEVAIHSMTQTVDRMNYDAIPSVIYTQPEIATVGLTERAAKEKGLDVRVVTLPLAYSGRHMAENTEADGFCKLIVNSKTRTLVGAHLASSYASEIIVMLSSMIDLEIDVQNITRLVFPHPTVGELIKDTLFQL